MSAKLNPEIKEKWIAALRSGEYPQHRGAIYNSDRTAFCCLGVLHRIVQKGSLGETYEAANITTGTGLCGVNDFVRMNDYEMLTFDQIADRIEKDY